MSIFCVLATGTVDPKGMSFTKRVNPKQRESDYIHALGTTAQQIQCPIVFCENSGYDLSKIEGCLKQFALDRYEIIDSRDTQNYNRSLGKGYGELMIIKRAIEKSKYIEKSDYIVKITGRYIIKNIKLILDDLEKQENFYVATMYVPNEKYTYSGLIVCKSDFILSYLIPLQNKIDDSKLQPIEVALHLAVENALQDGNRCISFVQKPQIIGYSGTWNAKIREDNYFDIELSVSSILIFLRKYRKAFIRRSKIFLNRINPYNQFKK